MDVYELSAFPKDVVEALTMLYLERQDLSGKSPQELVTLYNETREEIYSFYYTGLLCSEGD